MSDRPDARQLADLVLDTGSFRNWDDVPLDPASITGYASELNAERARTGIDEAVITGEGRIQGRRVAVMACEFSFLAGSIGVAAAERLVRAVERATTERLPLLASPVSGGTRMQEGTTAFVQMVKIATAIARHKAAALPYLVYLRHPTTGGAFASWGSLGHITVAEPGALVGFLGPRVYESLHGKAFPSGVQVSENLYDRGLIDAVLEPGGISAGLRSALNVLCAERSAFTTPEHQGCPDTLPNTPAWESVTRSRRQDRPGVRGLLRHAARDVVRLSGSGRGERDSGLIIALARFGPTPCVLLGQDRRAQADSPLSPGALRTALRGMALAAELDLPLVTVIDTPGADLSVEAEEGGMAGEIARCLETLATIAVPTLTLLMGQGTGGAALALLPADCVVAAEHGWLSPLPPEGASAIVHRDITHAAEMAESQRIRALDLRAQGIVDRIVAERPDAADQPEEFCRRMGAVVEQELARLLGQDREDRQKSRFERFRRLGLD